jgi:hypothetical protein
VQPTGDQNDTFVGRVTMSGAQIGLEIVDTIFNVLCEWLCHFLLGLGRLVGGLAQNGMDNLVQCHISVSLAV